MEFQIRKNSHVPVYLQLEDQLRFAISTEALRGGERLPSIRELARKLSINVNTVSKVYQRLQEQGLIVTSGPKGAFVSSPIQGAASHNGELDTPRQHGSHEGLVEIVDAAILEALRSGHELADLRRVFNERIKAVQNKDDLPTVAFIECSGIQTRDYVEELKSHFRANFRPVVLSDLQNQQELVRSADLIVTTLFHLGQVKDLVDKTKEVVGVVVNPQVEMLHRLSDLPAGTKLGGICRDEESVTTMRISLQDVCTKDVEISSCTLSDKVALERLLSCADVLVYTPPCRDEIEKLAPANLPRIEQRFEIAVNSLRFLKQRIDALSSSSSALERE